MCRQRGPGPTPGAAGGPTGTNGFGQPADSTGVVHGAVSVRLLSAAAAADAAGRVVADDAWPPTAVKRLQSRSQTKRRPTMDLAWRRIDAEGNYHRFGVLGGSSRGPGRTASRIRCTHAVEPAARNVWSSRSPYSGRHVSPSSLFGGRALGGCALWVFGADGQGAPRWGELWQKKEEQQLRNEHRPHPSELDWVNVNPSSLALGMENTLRHLKAQKPKLSCPWTFRCGC